MINSKRFCFTSKIFSI